MTEEEFRTGSLSAVAKDAELSMRSGVYGDEQLPNNMNASYADAVNNLCADIHGDNVKAGWWKVVDGVTQPRNVGELLMLIVSEVAEGMEGDRKSLKDDKLPHRDMLEVELADAVIRICDLAGFKGYDLGGAIAEKRAFNASRADHKLENRLKPGGKAY